MLMYFLIVCCSHELAFLFKQKWALPLIIIRSISRYSTSIETKENILDTVDNSVRLHLLSQLDLVCETLKSAESMF